MSASGVQFLNIELWVYFYFFTMDSAVSTKIIQIFIALLTKDEWYAWFQPDRATAHTWQKKKWWTFQPIFLKIELYLNEDGRQEAQILHCQTFFCEHI